jgi:hypothetical protein
MYTSISKIFAFGLLVSAPLANALAIPSQSQDLARSVDSIEARHHTEAQIAVSSLTPTTIQGSANTRKAKKAKANAATPATTATAKCGRSIEDREPHHTEAQIVSFPASTNHQKYFNTEQAAKKAKAGTAATPATTATTAKCGRSIEDREPHHTEAQVCELSSRQILFLHWNKC